MKGLVTKLIFMAVIGSVFMLVAAAAAGAVPVSLNVTSPTHPDENAWYAGSSPSFSISYNSPLAELSLTGTQDVAVDGSHAYVAGGTSGLEVVDISDPAAPVLAGSLATPGSANHVAVSGAFAYVSEGTDGLLIIDVSDPANPVVAGSYATDAGAVAVSGGYAYVITGNRLQIINVSNPAAPVLEGSYAMMSPNEVAVNGNYAYVADSFSGLVIINVGNPAAPTVAGQYYFNGVASVTVAVNQPSGRLYAYVGSPAGDGVRIVDVSNPAAPVLASSYAAGYVVDMAMSGGFLCVANSDPFLHDAGLSIINTDNPASPATAGSYYFAPKGSFYPAGMAVGGGNAYVVGTGSLRIYRAEPVQYSYTLDQAPGTAPDLVPEGSITPGGTATVAYTGLADGEYYFHVAAVDGSGLGPVSQRRVRIDSTCGQKPGLTLSVNSVRWASYQDYLTGVLTVDYSLMNATGPKAYVATVAGNLSTNGVTVSSVLPQTAGDLAVGAGATVSLRYQVPSTVTYFKSAIYVSASDICGGVYNYPGPFPGP